MLPSRKHELCSVIDHIGIGAAQGRDYMVVSRHSAAAVGTHRTGTALEHHGGLCWLSSKQHNALV